MPSKALQALVFLSITTASPAAGQDSAPGPDRYEGTVIDVHLHAFPADGNGPPGGEICVGPAAELRYDPATPWPEFFGRRMFEPPCADPMVGALIDEDVLVGTLEQMRKYKVRGILSSSDGEFAKWDAAAPSLFIRGFEFAPGAAHPSAEALGAMFASGTIGALAEVASQYDGVLADDPALEPYFRAAEEHDIPVGIHIGVGPPGTPLLAPGYRLQSPTRLESVLRAHPRLRVYAMHAGYPFIAEMKAMLYAFPQLYVDTGVLQMSIPRAEYYAYLEELVRAGYGDRIMFGSDQMNWPGLIGEGIDAINDAPFLSYDQKKAILHDNAARFLRMKGE